MSSSTNSAGKFHCDLTGGMVWKLPLTEATKPAVKDSEVSLRSHREFYEELLKALKANPKILGK